MLCPVEPLCWAGLVAIGGRADRPPRDVDCTQTHAWETFAATVLPPDVSRSQEDELLQREDMAQACSKARLASRSRDPEATRDWQVEAWPIAMKDSRLVHCIATGEAGGTRGSVFRSGG
jgi:serine/threonine-protein kinase